MREHNGGHKITLAHIVNGLRNRGYYEEEILDALLCEAKKVRASIESLRKKPE